MNEVELEQKLKALVKADIINQGRTNADYQAVDDNIFDKVFRGAYQKDVQDFDEKEISNEYKAMFEKSEKKYRKLLGTYNQEKGLYAEIIFMIHLKFRAYHNNRLFQSITNNLPEDFRFIKYQSVESYSVSSQEKKEFQLDLLANAGEEGYSLIVEIKNRVKKFDLKEAKAFKEKLEELLSRESLPQSLGLVYSLPGFTKGALDFFRKNNLAWSQDEKWLDLETK